MNTSDQLNLRKFDGIDTRTVSINDYRSIGRQLAEVIVSVTGSLAGSDLIDKLQDKIGTGARPIVGSFQWLTEGKTAVGFVAVGNVMRVLDSKTELNANYKHVAKNMYTDDDDTLWEFRSGAGGDYLVRTGDDELPAIMATVKAHRKVGIHMIANLQAAHVESHQLVAYIGSNNEMSYGVSVGKAKGSDAKAVLNSVTLQVAKVATDLIVESRSIDLPAGTERMTAGFDDAERVIDYWRKAMSHGETSGYLEKLIQQINEQAAA